MTALTAAALVQSLAASNGWTPLESHDQPACAARHAAIPAILHPKLNAGLRARLQGGLYHHQAKAIQLLSEGADVALTTPTSSGKSLVFMTGALQILVGDRQARILALYPMKALGNDQLAKWQATLAPFKLKVAVLDGDTPMAAREALLAENQVLIMTPDVLHSWFMSNLHRPGVRAFRDSLRMLILDEAHVYDGVFGSSMAYLLRRLEACGPSFQMIASSATIGEVDSFLTRLTGRTLEHVAAEDDGSPRYRVLWQRIAHTGKDVFSARVELMKSLAAEGIRFIAFADSRKSAELHAFALRRGEGSGEETTDDLAELNSICGILPYRSGFEAADRKKIETALASGQLRGVIATSALELGVDIPGIDCVILIGTPPSQKSLRQRAGRTGRHAEGAVLLMDSPLSGPDASLQTLLNRPVEANHLSLDNRLLEFIHVLCATHEAAACGEAWSSATLDSLSPQIAHLLAGEREGGQTLDNDLFELKAKAGGTPQRAFSLRSGKENNFEIFCQGQRLGTISFPQVLREAYPGAVYYHLSTPYRVRIVKPTKGIIEVTREKGYTTTPLFQSRVFVTLRQGDTVRSGAAGFVYSGDLQIAERVTGFREKQGPKKTLTETYGPRSMVSQRSFDRCLRSTGICWAIEGQSSPPEEAAVRLLAAAALRFGLCRSDLGIGRFQSQQNPWGASPVTGLCIYDRIEGGLRLTDQLFHHFASVAAETRDQAIADAADPAVIAHLHTLAAAASDWKLPSGSDFGLVPSSPAAGFIEVIQPGSPAYYTHRDHHEQVTVLTFMPGPEGLEYLVTLAAGGTKRIKVPFVRPIEGLTQMMTIPAELLGTTLQAA